MSAIIPQRRKQTAAELAKKFGKSKRTIYRVMAEPREVYEARAAERHARIRELRAEGLSMRAIAAQVNVTVGTVHYALNKDQQISEV